MGTQYTLEFWRWAHEHGYPERKPKGSPENYERWRLLPILYKQWREELRIK